VTGIPDGAYVHAVREDPKRRGMLYAGTELGVLFRSMTARLAAVATEFAGLTHSRSRREG